MLYPLPAVMVSCQRPGEKPNIITVAWAGTVCSSPAMVSISVRPERYSYHIIKEQVLELGSHHMFVAEVLGVDVDESYLDAKGKFQLNKAGLMVYSHGEYFGLGKKLGSFGYSVRKKKK